MNCSILRIPKLTYAEGVLEQLKNGFQFHGCEVESDEAMLDNFWVEGMTRDLSPNRSSPGSKCLGLESKILPSSLL